MELRDELLTVAELAVGIAGFSAIVAAFFRGRRLSNVDIERFRGLLVVAGSAVALAFIPSLLESSGFSGSTLWRVASGLMIAAWFTAMIPFAVY